MDIARALVAKGREIALVSRTMGVSLAQLSLRINRSANWQDMRCNRRNDEADAEILSASYREHGLPVSENLLKQDFYASGPNQKWAGDITYRVPGVQGEHGGSNEPRVCLEY